jgi:hypothetical protein
MKARNLLGVAGVMAALTMPVAASTEPAQDKKITVVGCAVSGEHGDGFLLVNKVERTLIAALSPTPEGIDVTTATATTLGPSRILFWLDDDDHVVRNMMGQTVEITGEAEGEIKRGDIKAERENGMIELEINAAGHKGNVKVPDVPSAIGSDQSVGDREQKLPYMVQKLDVKSARSVSPTCQQ